MLTNRNSSNHPSGPATAPLPKMTTASGCISISHASHGKQTVERNSPGIRFENQSNQSTPSNSTANEPTGNAISQPRVALYSHDTMGLGHLRRNLLIAQSLSEAPLGATSLLITGAHEANFFTLPKQSDFLTLPRLRKEADGNYSSGQLAISIEDLISLRADSICSALTTFQPDVLIVDKVPSGAFGELLPTLRTLNEYTSTRCVLGIRDVLDDPETVRAEFEKSDSYALIDRFFEEIWIYGDQRIYDPVKEYHWPKSIAEKVKFTGYLDQTNRTSSLDTLSDSCPLEFEDIEDRLIVCTLGGGQDGLDLGRAFLESLPTTGYTGVLLAGPYMEQGALRSLQEAALERGNCQVLDFTPEANQLICRANRVIAMGGYNTVCSVLSYQKAALIVPRVCPRSEQWIRAERLKNLGLLDVLHPQYLSGNALHDWITSDRCETAKASFLVEFDGLVEVRNLCGKLIHQTISNSSKERA